MSRADRVARERTREHWVSALLQRSAVLSVHKMVKSAQHGITSHSESLRIAFNACKVSSHLRSTLVYCIRPVATPDFGTAQTHVS